MVLHEHQLDTANGPAQRQKAGDESKDAKCSVKSGISSFFVAWWIKHCHSLSLLVRKGCAQPCLQELFLHRRSHTLYILVVESEETGPGLLVRPSFSWPERLEHGNKIWYEQNEGQDCQDRPRRTYDSGDDGIYQVRAVTQC